MNPPLTASQESLVRYKFLSPLFTIFIQEFTKEGFIRKNWKVCELNGEEKIFVSFVRDERF